MLLHEGTFLKRILIEYSEQASAAVFRNLLSIEDWLGTNKADFLNRISLFVQVWGDGTSDLLSADTISLKLSSYGRGYQRKVVNILAALAKEDMEYAVFYPTGASPSMGNTQLQARAHDWLATEDHRFLIEVQAYLLDDVCNATVKTFP